MRKHELSQDYYMEHARKLAGNWKKFNSFAWFGKREIDNPDNWAIVYTSNRDSTLLDQSNEHAINEIMKPFMEEGEEGQEPEAIQERHNHWAVGYVDGYSIKCFDDDGNPTEAIKTWINVQYALEQYPVLDEDHYSQIEHEATCENVQMQTSYICRKHDLDYSDELAGQVHEWLSEHKPGSLESRDDQGGYPDDEEIEEALEALGLLVTVDSE